MPSYTNQTKHSSSWGDGTLHASTFTDQNKSFTSFDFLLLENGSYILQESGFKFILEQTPTQSVWTTINES